MQIHLRKFWPQSGSKCIAEMALVTHPIKENNTIVKTFEFWPICSNLSVLKNFSFVTF
jgi:hypothetical protein